MPSSLCGIPFQGTTITISTKTAQRYEGVVVSTNSEGNTTGLTIKDVRDLNDSDTPPKDHLFIASTNIETWSSGPADVRVPNGAGDSAYNTLPSLPVFLASFSPPLIPTCPQVSEQTQISARRRVRGAIASCKRGSLGPLQSPPYLHLWPP